MATHSSTPLTWNNPIWRSIGKLYQRPGVEQLCLALQDRHGAPVVFLLTTAWSWPKRLPWKTLQARLDNWPQTIAEIRRLRRALPLPGSVPGATETRKWVLKLELASEQLLTALLWQSIREWLPPDTVPGEAAGRQPGPSALANELIQHLPAEEAAKSEAKQLCLKLSDALFL